MDPQNQAPNNQNQFPPGNSNPDNDINQQYQDILNKYAEELNKISQESEPSAPPLPSASKPQIQENQFAPQPESSSPSGGYDLPPIPPSQPDTSLTDELSAMLNHTLPSTDQPKPSDNPPQAPLSSSPSPTEPQETPVPPADLIVALPQINLQAEPQPQPEIPPKELSYQPETPPTLNPYPETNTVLPTDTYTSEIQSKPDILSGQDSISPPLPPSMPTPQFDSIAPDLSQKPTGGIFKVLFIISLIVFIVVSGILAYTFVQNQNSTPNSQSETGDDTQTPTESQLVEYCELNDNKYKVGESFAAADGCNTCSCQPDLTIACTEKDCSTSVPEESSPEE